MSNLLSPQPPPQQSESWPVTSAVTFNFSFLSATPTPVLRVVIKGNCVATPINHSFSHQACLQSFPAKGCRNPEHNPTKPVVLYPGQHLGEASTESAMFNSLTVESHGSRAETSLQTLSMLDDMLCEYCSAPSSLHLAEHVRQVGRTIVSAAQRTSLSDAERAQVALRRSLAGWRVGIYSSSYSPPLYNLSYSIAFRPRVGGAHLVHVRLDYASEAAALQPTAESDADTWRGPFLGERVGGSPFSLDVGSDVFREVRKKKPACKVSDFADLGNAALIAPDAESLRLPSSRWRYEPLGCTLRPFHVKCSGVAACLERHPVALLGDSAMERLRYAFAETLLPAAGLREWGECGSHTSCDSRWFFASNWDFNPKYLIAKETINSVADLSTSECAHEQERRQAKAALRKRGDRKSLYEAMSLQPDVVEQCPNTSVRGSLVSLSEYDRKDVAFRQAPSKLGSSFRQAANGSCDNLAQSILVMNLGGLHAVAWAELTDDAWGAALRHSLSLATSLFRRVIYLTTPTPHPINFPHASKMGAEFHRLNAVRSRRANEIERRAIAKNFPSVTLVDIATITSLLDDASLKCTDIRHHDFDANRLMMAMLIAVLCGTDAWAHP